MHQSKSAFRRYALERVLSPERRAFASASIRDKIHEICQPCRCIAMFAAMKDEPDLDPLIEMLIREGKTVALPRVENAELHFYAISSLDELVPHPRFALREPKPIRFVPTKDIDAFFVPGVAFDRAGHRLGHGKGYYDRCLSQVKAKKYGAAFANRIFESIPFDPHDIIMDELIHEMVI